MRPCTCPDTAGVRQERITVQKIKASPVLTSLGEADLTAAGSWETYATRWATVDTAGGREFWKRQRVQAEVVAIFRVPWDADTKSITPQMRVVDEAGTVFEIAAAFDVDHQRTTVEIQCKAPAV
jgi:head-tail adaptor